jgi:cytochrome oxidase Cu insertion factor (SCO1/SenC/PrrC family)
VEDRLTPHRAGYPGLALVALATIVAITAAWWALALWPASATLPEWLSRTRAACFGAEPGSLPDAGGWVLLVGEPLGMAGVLIAIWGRELASDLERLRAHPRLRLLGTGLSIAVIVALAVFGVRVARAYASGRPSAATEPGVLTRPRVGVPSIPLVDQSGRRVLLTDFHGQSVLLTFAFGHCTTVCPTLVTDLIAARRAAHRGDVRLIVVTLDPWRDTPDRLPSLAAHWDLAPGDRVLSGSVADIDAVLAALGIGRARNETSGGIEHGATVMLVERGRVSWRLDGWWGRIGDLLSR